MNIVTEKPWFWFIVEALTPEAKWGKVIFAFGDRIYTPMVVPDHIIVHERTHLRQQRYSKIFGVVQLIRYNLSKSFRLKCETEAYQEQINFIKKNHPYRWHDMVQKLAEDLSGPLYGNIISYRDAFKLLLT